MIRLNKDYSLSYKNGYFIAHKHSIKGAESKQAGEEYIAFTQTYPTALRSWEVLKEEGVDGNETMKAVDQLLMQNQRDIYNSFVAAKAAKAAKEEKLNKEQS